MGKALLVIIIVVLFVYAFFDLAATPKHRVRFLPKPLWFVALLAVPIGPLLWIFFGANRIHEVGPIRPSPRPGPRGPDDDPDYLRDL